MVKTRALILAALALGSIAHASDYKQGDSLRGYDWKHMSQDDKTTYVAGYADGYTELAGINGYKIPWHSSLTANMVASGIDECYADPHNQKLPFLTCFYWTMWRTDGASEAKLKAFIQKFRDLEDKQIK